VGALAAALKMKPQAVSNQLRGLVQGGVLTGRRRANRMHYRIVDPATVRLLELGLRQAEGRARSRSK
jgi:DNA-binding transcriptional ArsR family regulator